MCHDLSKTYNVRLICLNKFQTRYDLHPRPPYDNTQTIPPTVGTHPRCVRREATGDFYPTYFRFRSDINTLRSPWNFGRTWGTSLRQTRYRHTFFDFSQRHYDTINPLYNIPTSPYDNTQTIPPNVGTHPRCVRQRATGGFHPTYFRFRSDSNALQPPWIFGRTWGASLRLTQHCRLSILHSDITARQHLGCVHRGATGGFSPTYFRFRSDIKKASKDFSFEALRGR